jgi:hypothetical protein
MHSNLIDELGEVHRGSLIYVKDIDINIPERWSRKPNQESVQ